MVTQHFATSLQVQVDGSPLEDWLREALVSWEIIDNRSVPDSFVLRFADRGYQVLRGTALKIGAKVKLSAQISSAAGPQPLLDGDITAIELEYDQQLGTCAVASGQSADHLLFRGRRTEAYPNLTIAEIVDKVAKRAGLSVADSSKIPAGGGEQDTVITQAGESDAEFLWRLARRCGAQWYVLERKLHFQPPDPPDAAPSTSTSATDSDVVLDPHDGLHALRASVSASGLVTEVQVPGWDPVKNEAVLGRAKVEHPSVEIEGLTPADVVSDVGASTDPLVCTDAVCVTQDEADAAAKAIADQIASGFAELDGTARGNPALLAGVAVTFSADMPLKGKYTLSSTRHYWSKQHGYLTDFVVSGASDRSLYGLIHGAEYSPESSSFRVGVVKDVADPKKQGRLSVNLPEFGADHKSGWLPVLHPGGGKDIGLYAPYAVGSQVLVAVSRNNPDAGYVLGGVHKDDTIPKLPDGVEPNDSSTGAVQGNVITVGGHQIALVNAASGKKKIVIKTADGKHFIEIDQTGSKLTVHTGGQVVIEATNGVQINAGSGQVQISGSQIQLKSSQVSVG